MEINDIYAQYCQFWDLFRTCNKYRNRRASAFGQWKERTQPARNAMLQTLQKEGPPNEANPYFWIQDFPEPVPTNWNGHTLQPGTQYVTAKWNGKWGTYTMEDVRDFNLEIKN